MLMEAPHSLALGFVLFPILPCVHNVCGRVQVCVCGDEGNGQGGARSHSVMGVPFFGISCCNTASDNTRCTA